MSEVKRDYEIGYGKPPVGRRFQKGQSGNPRGPRRKDLSALLVAALNEPVYTTIDGHRRKITKREAIIKQMVDKSAEADLRATKMLFDMLKEVEEKAGTASPPEPAQLTAPDREVVELFIARLRRQIAAEMAEAAAVGTPASPVDMPAPPEVAGDIPWEECAALLRDDFASFAARSFHELNPRTPFAANWHVDLIAAKLAAVREGHIRRLIVSLPPRHLKSHLASIAFPAWCMGHDPSASIICVSYAQDLADKLSRDCRRILAADWYQRLFPTRLSPRHQAVPEFETTAQGSRVATSVGGVLTGRGADIIVIDDPLKPEEALSQTQRQAANEWYDHTLYSRLNDKLSGAIVLIMHRLHEDDLAGHVLTQEPWEVVRISAIADEDEVHRVETVFGHQSFGRKAGEVLHPEREPPEMLEQIRRTLGEYNFAGQYQQAPSPQGGGMVKAVWFRRYAPNERPDEFDRVVQSWDTANKASELSDFSVCTSWGIKGKDLYLLHVLRRRMEYPELKRAVCEQCEAFNASVVLIEDKVSGTQLIQELIDYGLHAVTRYQPQSDKVMRMHAQTAMIENGFVHLPKEASWLPEYLHELTAFPKGKHDDQVDSTAQMLDWMKRAGSGPSSNAGIWQLYKERYEAQQTGASETAKLPPLSTLLPILRRL